jgi:hypothetical protein
MARLVSSCGSHKLVPKREERAEVAGAKLTGSVFGGEFSANVFKGETN